jgi:hypothetical protein
LPVNVSVIVTAPPYVGHLAEVTRHPLVDGLRLNTVMPLKESPLEVLKRLADLGKPLWVDLKSRRLRVVGSAIPPFTEVRLSHRIQVKTPVEAWFSDGLERVIVAEVDGDRLILANGPQRLVGPGESVNILHNSLKVEGTLTETDRTYLAAMRKLGLKTVMLSYVESPDDSVEVRELLPGAELVLKVESRRGLDYVRRLGSRDGRLMAARGDLYIEVGRPHRIVGALQTILQADTQAIAASRILDSLVRYPVPSCADIGDLAFLMLLGYRTYMLGDVQCFERQTVLEALNLIQAVAGQFA